MPDITSFKKLAIEELELCVSKPYTMDLPYVFTGSGTSPLMEN